MSMRLQHGVLLVVILLLALSALLLGPWSQVAKGAVGDSMAFQGLEADNEGAAA